MKNLLNYKSFEAHQMGNLNVSSREDLTNYYRCNDCNNVYRVFNNSHDVCQHCKSTNLEQISDFDYMAELKTRLSPEEFGKELANKNKRENDFIDLVSVGVATEMNKRKRNIN